jgi:hypothetical protein
MLHRQIAQKNEYIIDSTIDSSLLKMDKEMPFFGSAVSELTVTTTPESLYLRLYIFRIALCSRKGNSVGFPGAL